ncbi:hypothetical protein AC1031_000609 [Aphanomyces cochlioides]|nr:hypothetical protein AC1031_000609 [Aphanomyces cochlioides]
MVFLLDFHGFDGKLKTTTTKFSFYFPVARFWQMAIGGILAYFDSPIMAATPWRTHLPAIASNAISLSGLAAVIVGHQSSHAVSRKLGALTDTRHGRINSHWATCAPEQVHPRLPSPCLHRSDQLRIVSLAFPVPCLCQHAYKGDQGLRPGYLEPYVLVIASVVVSIATLYFVENQLRRRQSPFVIPLLSLCMVALVVLGICATYYPASFSAIERKIAAEKAASSVAHPDIDESSMPTLSWSAGPTVVHPTIGKVLAAQGDSKPFDRYDGYNDSMANDEAIKVLNRKQTESSSANTAAVNATIVVLGDSFARMVAPRFVKLLEKAQQKNQAFPTIYYATRWGDAPSHALPRMVRFSTLLSNSSPKLCFTAPTGCSTSELLAMATRRRLLLLAAGTGIVVGTKTRQT